MAKKSSTDLTSLGANNALIFRSNFNGCDISQCWSSQSRSPTPAKTTERFFSLYDTESNYSTYVSLRYCRSRAFCFITAQLYFFHIKAHSHGVRREENLPLYFYNLMMFKLYLNALCYSYQY